MINTADRWFDRKGWNVGVLCLSMTLQGITANLVVTSVLRRALIVCSSLAVLAMSSLLRLLLGLLRLDLNQEHFAVVPPPL